ncbi:aa3-type cytochrome oxidase subunit CtaJ [Symbioplanes lichenis]|uniref:aa3-type cytochrome oxidase subunit CtaJ n=1 Tax=Symbioplanes lichenis TaxID=1629072 RepID=UPI002738BCE3|nr:hypothetical protein [Actinoplanes lichenis]
MFAVIPVAFIGVVAALVFATSRRHEPDRRYRPGRPFDFEPIWFVSSPQQVSEAAPAKVIEAGQDATGRPVARPATVGGASDRW